MLQSKLPSRGSFSCVQINSADINCFALLVSSLFILFYGVYIKSRGAAV